MVVSPPIKGISQSLILSSRALGSVPKYLWLIRDVAMSVQVIQVLLGKLNLATVTSGSPCSGTVTLASLALTEFFL